MKNLLIGIFILMISASVLLAADQTQTHDRNDPAITWNTRESTVVHPGENTSIDAWEAYKSYNWTPSVDQHLDDPVLRGAIDTHAHFGPDSYARQWDAFEIARLARERGMRGIVLKNHWSESAGLAYLARKYAAPGLEVFGGLALNAPEGGINPQAVRYFAEVEGNYGKVVWMPTHDAEHEVKYNHQSRPFVRVSRGGVLVPEVFEVLDLVKQYDLTLATGHVAPEEMLMIVNEAQKRGIHRIIITHPDLGPMYTDASVDQLGQAIAMGSYVELVSTQLLRETRDKMISMIRDLGPEHFIISSDSGLTGTPNHADALVMAARVLRQSGFSENELNLMFKENPARVLGLTAQSGSQ